MNTKIKVRGYHLDAYNHVNNARYLEFLEEARWELFEQSPIKAVVEQRKLAFVVVNINISYRYPATSGDVLEISTSIANVGTKSLSFKQIITLENTTTEVVDALVTFVFLDASTGKPIVIDEELARLLNQEQ